MVKLKFIFNQSIRKVSRHGLLLILPVCRFHSDVHRNVHAFSPLYLAASHKPSIKKKNSILLLQRPRSLLCSGSVCDLCSDIAILLQFSHAQLRPVHKAPHTQPHTLHASCFKHDWESERTL